MNYSSPLQTATAGLVIFAKTRLKTTLLLLLALISTTPQVLAQTSAAGGWKAGVAKLNITPKTPMWLAGYGSRTHPSDGTLHDLWAKALVFEDASGNKAVLITTDLVGIPKGISDEIRNQLQKRYGLSKAQIILNSSHTHSGPVLENALSDIYPLDADQLRRVSDYSRQFEKGVVDLVGKALKSMEPVQLFSFNGVARFQVNRRNNQETTLVRQTELKGPNDPAVPVIKVVDNKGNLKAIAFGYACHPTVLDLYKWSGDFPGFAQIELEKEHPGTVALFFQGTGADQNPLPRRTIPLAQQYGRELAAAVERVLQEDMRKLTPEITAVYAEPELPIATPDSPELLEKMAAQQPANYQARWAGRVLAKMKAGEKLTTSYPFPMQVWKLGEQPILTFGGETVVHYSNEMKRLFGHDIFVMGYTNDVMSYIPSSVILQEGGYEGAMAHIVYGLPAKWGADTESIIINAMTQLAVKAGLKQTN
jgi:neutral ceramidase